MGGPSDAQRRARSWPRLQTGALCLWAEGPQVNALGRPIRSVVIVSDAWHPQVNGVVRSLDYTIADLRRRGLRVVIIHPGQFRTIPCPTYPEIRLSLTTARRMRALLAQARADHVHIASEGPLGVLAAAACRKLGRVYTTSYHTRFPEYLAARAPVPLGLSYAMLRRFHNRAGACLVATPALQDELATRGFDTLRLWPRGVDAELFHPRQAGDVFADLPRPIWLTVARVSVEKSLSDFLGLDLPGSKVVVGDGPALATLRRRFPGAHFVGLKEGPDLARHYASADVFVFPSRTETFGLVLLEALASGLPVAAYPVRGPLDIVTSGKDGVLSDNLEAAAKAALALDAETCRAAALRHSWTACTDRFLEIAQEVEDRVRFAGLPALDRD